MNSKGCEFETFNSVEFHGITADSGIQPGTTCRISRQVRGNRNRSLDWRGTRTQEVTIL